MEGRTPLTLTVTIILFLSYLTTVVQFPSTDAGPGEASEAEDTDRTRGIKIRGDPGSVPEYPLGLDLPEVPPSCVILAPESFQDEVAALAVHRTRMGLPTVIYPIESVDGNYSGPDREARVHSFLRDLHDLYPAFKWLLIMADSEFLAPRALWHYALDRGQQYHNYYYSDVYYAGLDSDWDDDIDGRYGEFSNITREVEGDLDFDVYVGRVPVSTQEQASNYTSKLIRYERNPGIGSWMSRFLNWGTVMEPPNNLDTPPYVYEPYRSNAFKVCEKVREALPDHLTNISLYDYPMLEGGSYDPDSPMDTLNRKNMLESFNQGASMLNFVGQARYNAMYLNDYGKPYGDGTNYVWNEPMGWDDTPYFQNGGDTALPFMYLSTCDSAKFYQTGWYEDKSLETWLTCGDGGAIGFISSTGTSYRGEEKTSSWGNWYLDEGFWDLFLKGGITRPGMAMYLQKEDYLETFLGPQTAVQEAVLGMVYSYILLGDPYVDIYTDIARRFRDPSLLDLTWYTGEHDYHVRVLDSSGEGVENPTITLYSPQVYRSFKGTEEGWCNFTVDLTGVSGLNMTLQAHNMVPSFGLFGVLPEIADLALLEETLDISDTDPDHGEEVVFSIRVANLGGMVAMSSRAHITYVGGNGDPTYLYSSLDLGDVVEKTGSNLSWSWKARAGQHTFRLMAQTSSDDLDLENNLLDIDISVPEPAFEFSQGSGVLLPGAVVRPGTDMSIRYSIYNHGVAPGPLGLRLFMGDPDEGGTPLGDEVPVGIVPVHGYSNGTAVFTAPGSTGMVYVRMDPGDDYPPDMTDEDLRVLLEVNRAPYSTGEIDLTMQEDGGPTLLNVDGSIEDPDDLDDEMAFSVSTHPSLDVRLILGEGGRADLLVEPASNWNGLARLNLTVDDGHGEVLIPVMIDVSPVNDPPLFTDSRNGIIQLEALEDFEMVFRLDVLDIEGEDVIIGSEDTPFSIGPQGDFNWTPTQEHVGTREYIVTARDKSGAETTAVLRIDVAQLDDPPEVEDPEDLTVYSDERSTFRLVVYDEEGGPLAFASDLEILEFSTDGTVYINATSAYIGEHEVTIEVTDGVNKVYTSFSLQVLDKKEKDRGTSSIDPQLILGAVGVVVILFSLLLILFLFLGKRGYGDDVEEERRTADDLYMEDLDGTTWHGGHHSGQAEKDPIDRTTKGEVVDGGYEREGE